MRIRETSIAAYEDHVGSANAKKTLHKILVVISNYNHVGGITCDDVEQILHLPHQSISSDINHLFNTGWVQESGNFGVTRYNSRAIKWVTKYQMGDPLPEIPRPRDAPNKDGAVVFDMTGHSAILGGSTAARILACPASYHEQLKSPASDTPSSYADEGTMLHSMIAGMMGGTGMVESMVNTEQAETLLKAVGLLDQLKVKYGGHFKVVAIEATVPMPFVPGSFGSVDLVLSNGSTIIIVDWKFGRGVLVRATYDDGQGETFNAQLMFYAVAARGAFGVRHFKKKKIVLAVIQPRATEPMDYVEATGEDLDQFHRAFQHAFIEALSRNAHRERGEHCRFASCKATCPLWTGPVIDLAVLDPKRAALEASTKPVESTEYGDYMSHALSMAELAETWAGEIRKQGHLYLEDGGVIPAWKLVPKRGLRKWVNPSEAAADLVLHGAQDEDIFTEPEVRSVAQVEKALKARNIALPEDMWMLVSSGTTIARSDDPRPESTHGMVIENMRKALKRL
jgi:hypothetical protein